MTSVPKPPKVAKIVICELPMTVKEIAKSAGITIVARAALIAAGTDQVTFHQGDANTPGGRPESPVPGALAD
jgi:hypothetical protein